MIKKARDDFVFRLREINKKDISKINQWRNDPELISMLGAPFRFIDIQVDENWFNSYMSNRNSMVRCSIVDEKDEIVGLISLVSINYLNQSAELHIMIGDKENQGKGIGSFAVGTMLEHAFMNLNLQRIELTVLASNFRAQKLYEKFGFVKEGVKRKSKFKNGVFEDMYMYAVLKNEYGELRKK